jgi:hypothetical protein
MRTTWYLNLSLGKLSKEKIDKEWKSIGAFKDKSIKKFAEKNNYKIIEQPC